MDTSIFRSSESVIVRSQPVESTLSFRGFARATTRGEALKKKSLDETSRTSARERSVAYLRSSSKPLRRETKAKTAFPKRYRKKEQSAFLSETRLRGGGVGGGRDGGRGVHLLVTFSLLVVTLLLVEGPLSLLFPPPAAAAAAAAAAVRGAARRAQNVRPIRAGDVHGFRLFVISTFDVVLDNLILCVGVRSCEELQIVQIETNTKGGV
jgi:hypothetical protein